MAGLGLGINLPAIVQQFVIDTSGVTGQLAKIDSSMAQATRRISSAGAKMSTAITLPTVAVSISGIEKYAELEKRLNVVTAIAENGAGKFDLLYKKAVELGGALDLPGVTAMDAAVAMEALAKAGFSASNAMNGAKGALQFMVAAEMDAESATDLLANMLITFNMGAGRAEEAANAMVAGANASTMSVQEMGTAMKYTSLNAETFGLTLQETVAAIGVLSNAGLQGSTAGTQLRMMLQKLTSPTDKAKKVLKDLGVVTTDAKDQMLPLSDILKQFFTTFAKAPDQMQMDAYYEFFGDKAAFNAIKDKLNLSASELDAMNQIFEVRGGSAFRALVKGIEKAGSGVGKSFDEMVGLVNKDDTAAKDILGAMMKGLNGAIERFRNTWDTFQIQLGKALKGAAGDILDFGTKIFSWFNHLSDASQQTAAKVLMFVAAFGPLLFIGAKLVSMTVKMAAGFKAFFLWMSKPWDQRLGSGKGDVDALSGSLDKTGAAASGAAKSMDPLSQKMKDMRSPAERVAKAVITMENALAKLPSSVQTALGPLDKLAVKYAEIATSAEIAANSSTALGLGSSTSKKSKKQKNAQLKASVPSSNASVAQNDVLTASTNVSSQIQADTETLRARTNALFDQMTLKANSDFMVISSLLAQGITRGAAQGVEFADTQFDMLVAKFKSAMQASAVYAKQMYDQTMTQFAPFETKQLQRAWQVAAKPAGQNFLPSKASVDYDMMFNAQREQIQQAFAGGPEAVDALFTQTIRDVPKKLRGSWEYAWRQVAKESGQFAKHGLDALDTQISAAFVNEQWEKAKAAGPAGITKMWNQSLAGGLDPRVVGSLRSLTNERAAEISKIMGESATPGFKQMDQYNRLYDPTRYNLQYRLQDKQRNIPSWEKSKRGYRDLEPSGVKGMEILETYRSQLDDVTAKLERLAGKGTLTFDKIAQAEQKAMKIMADANKRIRAVGIGYDDLKMIASRGNKIVAGTLEHLRELQIDLAARTSSQGMAQLAQNKAEMESWNSKRRALEFYLQLLWKSEAEHKVALANLQAFDAQYQAFLADRARGGIAPQQTIIDSEAWLEAERLHNLMMQNAAEGIAAFEMLGEQLKKNAYAAANADALTAEWLAAEINYSERSAAEMAKRRSMLASMFADANLPAEVLQSKLGVLNQQMNTLSGGASNLRTVFAGAVPPKVMSVFDSMNITFEEFIQICAGAGNAYSLFVDRFASDSAVGMSNLQQMSNAWFGLGTAATQTATLLNGVADQFAVSMMTADAGLSEAFAVGSKIIVAAEQQIVGSNGNLVGSFAKLRTTSVDDIYALGRATIEAEAAITRAWLDAEATWARREATISAFAKNASGAMSQLAIAIQFLPIQNADASLATLSTEMTRASAGALSLEKYLALIFRPEVLERIDLAKIKIAEFTEYMQSRTGVLAAQIKTIEAALAQEQAAAIANTATWNAMTSQQQAGFNKLIAWLGGSMTAVKELGVQADITSKKMEQIPAAAGGKSGKLAKWGNAAMMGSMMAAPMVEGPAGAVMNTAGMGGMFGSMISPGWGTVIGGVLGAAFGVIREISKANKNASKEISSIASQTDRDMEFWEKAAAKATEMRQKAMEEARKAEDAANNNSAESRRKAAETQRMLASLPKKALENVGDSGMSTIDKWYRGILGQPLDDLKQYKNSAKEVFESYDKVISMTLRNLDEKISRHTYNIAKIDLKYLGAFDGLKDQIKDVEWALKGWENQAENLKRAYEPAIRDLEKRIADLNDVETPEEKMAKARKNLVKNELRRQILLAGENDTLKSALQSKMELIDTEIELIDLGVERKKLTNELQQIPLQADLDRQKDSLDAQLNPIQIQIDQHKQRLDLLNQQYAVLERQRDLEARAEERLKKRLELEQQIVQILDDANKKRQQQNQDGAGSEAPGDTPPNEGKPIFDRSKYKGPAAKNPIENPIEVAKDALLRSKLAFNEKQAVDNINLVAEALDIAQQSGLGGDTARLGIDSILSKISDPKSEKQLRKYGIVLEDLNGNGNQLDDTFDSLVKTNLSLTDAVMLFGKSGAKAYFSFKDGVIQNLDDIRKKWVDVDNQVKQSKMLDVKWGNKNWSADGSRQFAEARKILGKEFENTKLAMSAYSKLLDTGVTWGLSAETKKKIELSWATLSDSAYRAFGKLNDNTKKGFAKTYANLIIGAENMRTKLADYAKAGLEPIGMGVAEAQGKIDAILEQQRAKMAEALANSNGDPALLSERMRQISNETIAEVAKISPAIAANMATSKEQLNIALDGVPPEVKARLAQVDPALREAMANLPSTAGNLGNNTKNGFIGSISTMPLDAAAIGSQTASSLIANLATEAALKLTRDAGKKHKRSFWEGLKDFPSNTWKSITNGISDWWNNSFGGGLADYSPPAKNARGGILQFAKGGMYGSNTGGGITKGPMAVIGEGSNPREYVIPTDQRYRSRAVMLLQQAMQEIGLTPNVQAEGLSARIGLSLGLELDSSTTVVQAQALASSLNETLAESLGAGTIDALQQTIDNGFVTTESLAAIESKGAIVGRTLADAVNNGFKEKIDASVSFALLQAVASMPAEMTNSYASRASAVNALPSDRFAQGAVGAQRGPEQQPIVHNTVNLTVEKMEVRNDQDIVAISRQLEELLRKQDRFRGSARV